MSTTDASNLEKSSTALDWTKYVTINPPNAVSF